MRRLVIGVVVTATLVAGGLWWRSGDEEPVEATTLETATVERGDLEVVVSATGTVEPFFSVEVKSKASGEVISFPYQPGDRLERQKLLVELDPEDEQRNLRRTESEVASNKASLAAAEAELARRVAEASLRRREVEASLESARAELEAAEARLQRAKNLFGDKLLSPEALDEARVNAAVAKARLALAEVGVGRAELDVHGIEAQRQEVLLRQSALERSRIALEEAQDRLEDTRIEAPIDGILLEKTVEQGQIIASGINSFDGGTTLCTIADTSVVLVVASVDEADIGRVRRGQQVRVTCDAHRRLELPGVVRRVLPQGVEESNVVLFKVRIEVSGGDKDRLLPGMTANVDIVVERQEDAVLVPNRALSFQDGTVGVEVVGEGWREVQRGLTDGDRTAVEGLVSGAEVVLGTVRERPEGGSGWFFGMGGRRSSGGKQNGQTGAQRGGSRPAGGPTGGRPAQQRQGGGGTQP
jgi:HlyD family secretion protein